MFFRSLMTALAISAMCFATSVAKASDHIEYYKHNGSLMKVVWDKQTFEFFEMYYEKPRAGLPVRKGTLLMRGSAAAVGFVTATARTFKQGCRAAEYRVEGWFDASGNNFSVSGKAPIRQGCKVVGYASTNNSSLVFTLTRR